MNEKQKKIEENAGMISLIMNGTGAVFILFGVFCLTNVQAAANLIGLDAETMKIFGGLIILAGIGDLIVAKIFIGKMKAK